MTGISPYVFNTFILLLFAVIVMWMCAGFTMLEAGSVSSRNASVICLKNLGLYAVASLAYYALGYNLMYVDVGRWAGTLKVPYEIALAEATLLADSGGETLQPTSDYASGADWFFQMVFVATTASILSGAIAERVKLWVFMVFIALLCSLIYPIVGAWAWGGGWLQTLGFQDFAGGTVVHSTGGWAALAGVLVMGPRAGRFPRGRPQKRIPASNVPLATLGVFILWMGWFGFNAGSQLRFAEAADAVRASTILINTNLAAACGLVSAFLVSRLILRRTELLGILNGAIAGLVAIAAGPDFTDHRMALVVGLGAGTALRARNGAARTDARGRRRRRRAGAPRRGAVGQHDRVPHHGRQPRGPARRDHVGRYLRLPGLDRDVDTARVGGGRAGIAGGRGRGAGHRRARRCRLPGLRAHVHPERSRGTGHGHGAQWGVTEKLSQEERTRRRYLAGIAVKFGIPALATVLLALVLVGVMFDIGPFSKRALIPEEIHTPKPVAGGNEDEGQRGKGARNLDPEQDTTNGRPASKRLSTQTGGS